MLVLLFASIAMATTVFGAQCATCERQILSALNSHRSDNRVRTLRVDPEMSVFATNWARVMAETGRKIHSDQRFGGENIASSYVAIVWLI